ncbi:mitochondrial fission ELM1 family protein [Acetobacter sp. AN02]|uniref:mitochondrial fission ELM1 family protein n=1 Tax=Acetobacter sp. AN02 TaxID=2894186 RepID=UPI0024344135|nr:mitochondrial fission ELM1 family protein [Acetobacter sp. AN02]MDG6095483.1 mitochondrial fission ELM1 family protein [Acetobacter sp. AN02]
MRTGEFPLTPECEAAALTLIAEDLAGMKSQVCGLAGHFALSARFLPVRMNAFRRHVPARFWPFPSRAVRGVPETGPVFSVAGKGGRVGAALRSAMRPVVQIQNPRLALSRFDLVVANVHDEISGPNVILTRTALHGLTPQVLETARTEWAVRLKSDDRPLVAVLAGGTNGRFRFGAEEARALVRNLHCALRSLNARLFITTSRRTGPEASAALRAAAADFGGEIWEGGADNPYQGLIACADFVIVTADSVSMVSEAVAGPAPVFVARLPGYSRRIGLFLETLRNSGRIRFFEDFLEAWPVVPLDDTAAAASEISRRLGLPLRPEAGSGIPDTQSGG